MLSKTESINARLSESMTGIYQEESENRQYPNTNTEKSTNVAPNSKDGAPKQSIWSNSYYVRVLPVVIMWITAGYMPSIFLTAWGAKYFGSDTNGTQTYNYDKWNRYYSIFMSASGLVAFLFSGLLGRISDSYGRKPIFYMCIILHFSLYAPLIWFNDPWIFFILLVPSGLIVARGSYTPSMLAYFSDVLPENQRTLAFSIGYGFGGIGLVVGTGLALGIRMVFASDQMEFIVISVINGIMFVYTIFVVPESLPSDRRKKFSVKDINPFKPFYNCCSHPIVLWTAIIEFLICFPETGALDIVLVYILDELNISNETKADGISVVCMACLAVGSFLGTFLLLPMLQRRKWNDLWILSCGIVIFMASFLLFAIFGVMSDERNMMIVLVAACLLLSIGLMSFPAINSILSRHLIKTEQGVGIGVVFAVRSLSWAVAPFLYSRLYHLFETIGMAQLLFSSTALAMLIALFLVHFPLKMYINMAKKNQSPFTFSNHQLQHNERMI